MNLSEIIKQYREEHDMTMQELADRCGLSKGYISMLENSFKPSNTKKNIIPSISSIKKLADGTNLDFDYLLSSVNGEISFLDQPVKITVSSTKNDDSKNLFYSDVELTRWLKTTFESNNKVVYDVFKLLSKLTEKKSFKRLSKYIEILIEEEEEE